MSDLHLLCLCEGFYLVVGQVAIFNIVLLLVLLHVLHLKRVRVVHLRADVGGLVAEVARAEFEGNSGLVFRQLRLMTHI